MTFIDILTWAIRRGVPKVLDSEYQGFVRGLEVLWKTSQGKKERTLKTRTSSVR